jgi:hypothetical protein
MTTFTMECFQNEYLAEGATEADAIVRITATQAPEAAADPAVARTEIIMLDVSGSMGLLKLRKARKAAEAAIDCLDEGVRFALIAGNHTATRLYPSIPGLALAVASPVTRQEAKYALARTRAGGGTAIGTWINLANGLIHDQPGINHAILLTDGDNASEEPEDLAAAVDAASGVFQCDCRGVGTDWRVDELRSISTALMGTVDVVAQPDDLAADFESIMRHSMGRRVASVNVRLWTPAGARVGFVKQVAPDILDLSQARIEISELVGDYATGAWGNESRDYHVSIAVPPGAVDEEMLAGRITLRVDDQDAAQERIRVQWTDDMALSTRINRQVAHYTGQAELADAIQVGLQALDAGDLDVATDKLGRAVRLADESDNRETAELLAKVVDVEPATGKVTVKQKVETVDLFTLDTRSTRTKRVSR